MLRYTTDRARPGLVALYDIRPGNGVGQFLQPQSPHGALRLKDTKHHHSNLSVHSQAEHVVSLYISDEACTLVFLVHLFLISASSWDRPKFSCPDTTPLSLPWTTLDPISIIYMLKMFTPSQSTFLMWYVHNK